MAAAVGSLTFDEDLAADGFGNAQVDDIFGDDDDIFNAPAPLPPLSPSRIDATANDGGGDEVTSDDKKKKKKVINRSPQPKLDDLRLCSDRGIPALTHLCDDIKFKGKGHEASDLKVLLQRFEHWAHRLYPKFPFNDVVEQVEILGGKKLVQNTIKSVRRGEDGEVNDSNSDEELQMNGNQEDSENAPSSTPSMDNANFGGQIEASNTPVPQLGLTPEQLERIRLNREMAFARRSQQKQALLASQTKDNAPSSPPSKPQGTSEEPSGHDSVSNSPERYKLNFETESDAGDVKDVAKETRDETMETRMTQNETMETSAVEKVGQDTEITENGMNDEIDINDEAMETAMTQNETMETMCNKKEVVTKEAEDVCGEAMATGLSEKGINDDDETMETKSLDVEITIETNDNESIDAGHAGKRTETINSKTLETLESIETATMETITMET